MARESRHERVGMIKEGRDEREKMIGESRRNDIVMYRYAEV